MSAQPTPPSRRDRTRPAELLVLSGVLAIFIGLIVLLSTREVVLALIFLGIAFIVSLIVLAMLSLAVRPTGDEQLDIDQQNLDQSREQGGPAGH
jgi:uncharacterized membrane protein HdeD (DUF308 family)